MFDVVLLIRISPACRPSPLFLAYSFCCSTCLPQPSVFGLPDNIERSVQRAASSVVIGGLRRLGAASVGGGTFDREM